MDIKFKSDSLLQELEEQGINKNILKAIKKVPRHLFVPENLQEEAYENYPLHIGQNQTISQPYTTAYMLQLLELKEIELILSLQGIYLGIIREKAFLV